MSRRYTLVTLLALVAAPQPFAAEMLPACKLRRIGLFMLNAIR